MTIGIIGACNVTLDFASRAIKSGHTILISHTRNNDTLKVAVQKMGCKAKLVSKEKAAKAKIIILFIPHADVEVFIADLPDMTGKILLHTNNPIFSTECLKSGLKTRLSSEIIAHFLPTAYSVKILTILEPVLILPKKINPNEIFYVTTNQKVKQKVETFFKKLDFSAYDFEEVCRSNIANRGVKYI